MSARVISAGGAGEHVAAADAALRAHQPGALHRQQDLLEVRLRQVGALRDLLDRGRPLGAVQRERQQRPGGVIAARRHPHAPIVASDAAASPAGPTLRRMTSSLGRRGAPCARRCVDRGHRARRCWATHDASWMPEPARDAESVVLLVLDGLGWNALRRTRSGHAASSRRWKAGRSRRSCRPPPHRR